MSGLARTLAILAVVIPAAGTLLSVVRHPHWLFRVWDFPRVQLAVTTAAGAAAWAMFFFRGTLPEVVMLAAAAIAVAWQIYKIYPYTPLAPKQVRSAEGGDPENAISLLVSNVLMENEERDHVIETVRERAPDVLLAVETDAAWAAALERALERDYPHRIAQPQDNYYGMLLFSRLPMRGEVRFLVQDDVPSIHARVELRSGVEVAIHALHPRPPEPLRDQRSTPRDAELIVVGRAVEKAEGEPVIVAGDLNDVAWSETSQLFVRISGLLDPRIGRGFYNSYNAKNPLARFPLDHVFHSKHFKLLKLERLRRVGSDHFPIYAELLFAQEAPAQQEESEEKPGDEKQARERLDKQGEDAAEGKDRPSKS